MLLRCTGVSYYAASVCWIWIYGCPCAYRAVRYCNMVGIMGDGQKYRQTDFLGPTYLAGLLG